MNEIVVISGKGGTGKTSLVACFASIAEKKVVADCDVDAADLHLVLKPEIRRREQFVGGKKARIKSDLCIGCGICKEVCRFDAISETGSPDSPRIIYRIDEISCEGCGVCHHFCPEGAVEFEDRVSGEWYRSETRYGPMVHAKLGIAQENSGKLVTIVRNQARAVAEEQDLDTILVDGSPGIGCPVIASITGASLVVIVTEPTLSA
jgi:MinD superfamily P-loop ATPase